MKRAFAKLILRRFSRRYEYDVTYLQEMAHVAPGAFFSYLLTAPLTRYRKAAPKDAYYTAKLVATRRFDCGPCLRLVVNMAREAGVDESTLRSVLGGNEEQVSDGVRLAMRYANAVIDQSAAELAELGETVASRWGQAAVTDLALAVAFGAFFPTMKRGLGYAQSCEPVLQELAAN